MHSYYNRKPLRYRSDPQQRKYKHFVNPEDMAQFVLEAGVKLEDTTSLLPTKRAMHDDTESFLSDESVGAEDEEEISLISDAVCPVLSIWKLFNGTPLTARIVCIVLAILALLILYFLVNILIQLVLLIMNPLYTFLGIIASAIIIYEFLGRRKRQKRDRQEESSSRQ